MSILKTLPTEPAPACRDAILTESVDPMVRATRALRGRAPYLKNGLNRDWIETVPSLRACSMGAPELAERTVTNGLYRNRIPETPIRLSMALLAGVGIWVLASLCVRFYGTPQWPRSKVTNRTSLENLFSGCFWLGCLDVVVNPVFSLAHGPSTNLESPGYPSECLCTSRSGGSSELVALLLLALTGLLVYAATPNTIRAVKATLAATLESSVTVMYWNIFHDFTLKLTDPKFQSILTVYDIMFFAETDMLLGEEKVADVPTVYTLISLPPKTFNVWLTPRRRYRFDNPRDF
ncbi:hypothetical protein B0H16DRAFT_1729632 [Mycena metata]|uniref:Uncharacterized protein n=1 Tax=Mycena metata TaxID=1033252 RepID=A0AAD7ICU6_9AGAR|nr:hypothetical protein B0H16DRAFT_1729632 [Mycena metata]